MRGHVTSDKRSLTYPSRAPESCGVHDQIRYATDVKEYLLSHIGKPQQDVLANAAARYNAWALHVQMGLSEPPNRAAVSALSLGGRDIDSEYLAQLPSGRVYRRDSSFVRSFPSSCGAKTLCFDLVWAVAAGAKKARGAFYERRRSANVASGNQFGRPRSFRNQRSVYSARRSRPILRRGSGVCVGGCGPCS